MSHRLFVASSSHHHKVKISELRVEFRISAEELPASISAALEAQ